VCAVYQQAEPLSRCVVKLLGPVEHMLLSMFVPIMVGCWDAWLESLQSFFSRTPVLRIWMHCITRFESWMNSGYDAVCWHGQLESCRVCVCVCVCVCVWGRPLLCAEQWESCVLYFTPIRRRYLLGSFTILTLPKRRIRLVHYLHRSYAAPCNANGV
jgi:hypothetical protein